LTGKQDGIERRDLSLPTPVWPPGPRQHAGYGLARSGRFALPNCRHHAFCRCPGIQTEPEVARVIRIRGARQNNLNNLDLELSTGGLIVVTGVSGSGKSSLVFETP
jgi:ABC-type multidrug transport system fused ATPase/permease subunit